MKKTLTKLWQTSLLVLGLGGASLNLQAQTTVTIADGTTNASTHGTFLTSSTINTYSISANLWTASELVANGASPGTINGIRFNKVTAGAWTGQGSTLKIWVKQVQSQTLLPLTGNITWATELGGATLVYDRVYAWPAATGFVGPDFDTPFFWDGSSSLVVLVEWFKGTGTFPDILFRTRGTINTATQRFIGNNLGTNLATLTTLGAGYNSRTETQFLLTPVSNYLDLGLTSITGLSSGILAGSYPVTLNVRNSGTVAIDSASISYRVNQGPIQNLFYNTAIPQFSNASIPLGNLTVVDGINTIEAWVNRANGVQDRSQRNDTTRLTINACGSQVSGNLTVNPSQPTGGTNYNTWAELTAKIGSCGLGGPLTVSFIAPNDTINGSIFLDADLARHPITLEGNNHVIRISPQASTTNYSFGIRVFRPRFGLTIRNFRVFQGTNSPSCFGIHILDTAQNVTITNNTITLMNTSTAATMAGIVFSGSVGSATTASAYRDVTITNNTVINGYYGISLYGLVRTPATRNLANTNFLIENNTLRGFYLYGIYGYAMGGARILRNDISRGERPAYGIFGGIFLTNTTTATNLRNFPPNEIAFNRIHTPLPNTHTGTNLSTQYGIYIGYCGGSAAGPHRVYNNVVYNFIGGGTTYAFYVTNADSTHFYNNSIDLRNFTTNTTNYTRAAFYTTGTANSNLVFVNNNMYSRRRSNGTVYGAYIASNLTNAAPNLRPTITNNNYFSEGPFGAFNYGFVSGASPTARATIADMNASGYETNSYNLNPVFQDTLQGFLYPNNISLDNRGIPYAGLATDFNGDPRSTTTPDIGAFEFPNGTFCAGLLGIQFSSGSTDVTGTWSNWGSNYEVEFALGSNAPRGSGTIVNRGSDTTYTFTNLAPGNPYTVYVRYRCANGVTSAWAGPFSFTAPLYNDDFCTPYNINIAQSGCGTVYASTQGATPQLGTGLNPRSCGGGNGIALQDVWFRFVMPTSGTVHFNFPSNNSQQARLYTLNGTGCDPATDVWNEVACASVGLNTPINPFSIPGLTAGTTYYLRVSGNTGSDQQGLFTFCATLDVTGLNKALDNLNLTLAPNPSRGEVSLRLEGYEGKPMNLRIVNTLGQVVENRSITFDSGNHTLNLNYLSRGLYRIELNGANGERALRTLVLE